MGEDLGLAALLEEVDGALERDRAAPAGDQRVAAERGLPEDEVRGLVAAATTGPVLGVLGQAAVNVLELNLALDRSAG